MTFLLIHSDTTAISHSSETSSFSFWFWLAIIEFVIILLLLLRRGKQNSKNLVFSELDGGEKENAKSTSIDMNNLMDSINNSNSLYKELSRKYHPDRFVNTPQHELAEKIFQDISRNKRNHEKLLSLKKRAETELNINL